MDRELTDARHRVLAALRFNWISTPDDVWKSAPFHVEGVHDRPSRALLDGLEDAARSPDSSPVGIVLQGQKGAGKTHLLGWVRERVQAEGGYFFLVEVESGVEFWRSVAQSVRDGLFRQTGSNGDTQLTLFLRRLTGLLWLPEPVRDAVVGDAPLTAEQMDTFVAALRRHDRQVGQECADTVRALALLASSDWEAEGVARDYLDSADEFDAEDRLRWRIRPRRRSPQAIVKDVSRLLALTGPTVVAVDQIDEIVSRSSVAIQDVADGVRPPADELAVDIAGGLMALHGATRRTLIVLSCLPNSWVELSRVADTVADRFRPVSQLQSIPTPEVGQRLIERRLEVVFRDVKFEPPYPSWPVRPAAFADAPSYTPRGLLRRLDEHVEAYRQTGEIRELESLAGQVAEAPAPPPPVEDLAALDARFAALRAQAVTGGALDPASEDTDMPPLLAAGLAAWIEERDQHAGAYRVDPPPSSKPALHARLRLSVDDEAEREERWSFRAIASGNAIAALHRIRAATAQSGAGGPDGRRHLVLLRNTPWPTGPKTSAAVREFQDAGGVDVPVKGVDLATFAALREMLRERHPRLHEWLLERRPATRTELLGTVLRDAARLEPGQAAAAPPTEAETPFDAAVVPAAEVPGVASAPEAGVAPQAGAAAEARVAPEAEAAPEAGATPEAEAVPEGESASVPVLAIGGAGSGPAVRVPLENLRKHLAIFAGSGSGKTVLIRRLVEDCALQGVSAIVLDPNNDLARLGDVWPESPTGWEPGDAERAQEYGRTVDVVVWTPGRESGRPLTFPPLPDFRRVRADADDLQLTVDTTVRVLAPRAKVDGETAKAQRSRAVLVEAVEFYARHDGRPSLQAFIELLEDLPEEAGTIPNAPRLAAELGASLRVAAVNDRLFGGAGTPVDPAVLLTPEPGRRARISVVSFVGLPDEKQRQSFVNQLQVALFSWIKDNPAGDRPLGGLLVMDEAQTVAPSGAMTPSTDSTITLASQARKYGLGLVFATQAPKALHNRIPGNAATQAFGFLNSPAQIAAAKEMARAKGSEVLDISRLGRGEFYVATEGTGFRKVLNPMCLSHHPPSPLPAEEVLLRARRRAG